MRIVVAPDSFKGSATGLQAARAIEAGLRRADKDVEADLVPMADGGEGTVEAVTGILGGEIVEVEARDPLDRPVVCLYGWVPDRRLAVVEMAAASGLPRMGGRLDPAEASTYGTGELIADALGRGAERLILGLGGSATVDAGTGLMAALGGRFLDGEGRELRGAGGSLGRVASIDLERLDPRLRTLRITIASDVTSPLLGPEGAVHVFGPQKGVTEDRLDAFEAGMAQFAERVSEASGVDRRDSPGSGAAGGIGFLLRSFLDVEFREGFPLIAGIAGLEARIAAADLAITGEGKLDAQSLAGKVPVSVARMARAAGVPAVAFAGRIDGDEALLAEGGLAALVPIVDRPMTLEEAMAATPDLLERAAFRFMRAVLLGAAVGGRGASD
jgi:glycerate kinase